MAAKKRKTTTTKVKKKKWFPIHAPAFFNEQLLGETYVHEDSDVQGKYLTANLSTIQKSFRKQSMNIHFRVTEVADGKASTEIIGYSLITSAVKRMVRRGRDKITDSFLAKTKDKKIIRMKPLIISMNKGTKSLQSALRLESRRVLREYAFTKDAQEIFTDIISGKVQKMIKQATAKLAPIKSVEMRIAKLDENSKVIVTDKDVESEQVIIRKKDEGEKHLSEEEIKAREEARAAALAEDIAKGVVSAPEDDAEDFDEDFGDEDEDDSDEEDEDSADEDSDESDFEEDADEDKSEDEPAEEEPAKEEPSEEEPSEDESSDDDSEEESDKKKE